jgi:hypothetical protein
MFSPSVSKKESPVKGVSKFGAFGVDLTKHPDFEQGDNCFTWCHHTLTVKVRLTCAINETAWVVSCPEKEIKTEFALMPHDELSAAIAQWISENTNESLTVWERFNRAIKGNYAIKVDSKKTLWETEGYRFSIYCDAYGQLTLVAQKEGVDGQECSLPLAVNPPHRGKGIKVTWVWTLAPNARQNYKAWVRNVKRMVA